MESKRKFTLRGKTTVVAFSSGRRDLVERLRSYPEKPFFVIDSSVAEIWGSGGIPEHSVIVRGGDSNKTAEQLIAIRERALECGLDGGDFRFIVIGGGVSIDLAAAAAGAYFPGARLTLIPTTLMAMTDGSLGGRCGVNSGKRRYISRDSYPADEVIVEIGFLSKLSTAQIRNGFGEIIKHAMLSPNTELTDLLMESRDRVRALDRTTMEKVILKSMDIKISYLLASEKNPVAEDILDLGHRFGFAFMLDGDGGVKHGEAVVWGIAKALELGLQQGITDTVFAFRARKLMELYEYDTRYKFPRNLVMRLLDSYDEAYGIDGHEVVLLRDQGKPELMKIDSGHLAWLIS